MAYDPLDNIFGDTQDERDKDKLKNPSASTSQSRTNSADPLENIFADSKPTAKQVQVQATSTPEVKKEEPSGFFDKALSVVGKVATSVGDWFNKQQKKNDEANFELGQIMYGKNTYTKDPTSGKVVISNPSLDAYKNAKTPDEKAKIIQEDQQKAPIMQFLNSDTGKKVTGFVAKNTSNIPLKVWAGIKSIGDDTYDEAYSALLAKEKDPNNPRWQKILYGLQDSGVQSGIGALLAVGATYLTRNPKVGQAVSLAYFAPISAESQREDNDGKVVSLGDVAIDTVGDTVISGFAEAALKNVIKEGGEATLKTFAKEMTKGFLVEGSTEPAQTFLKYANDYKNAGTEADKQKVVASLTQYVKSGGMVDEFLIGGLSGAGITGIAAAGGKVLGDGSSANEVNPVLQSEGGEAPKEGGKVVGKLNVDFSSVRDEVGTLQEALQADPQNDTIAKDLATAQSNLTDYQNSVKERPIYISDDTQESPLATVETVQYPDGKFSYRFSADTQTSSIQSPFLSNETFKTKKEAIEAGKGQILSWIDEKIKTATAEEIAKLNEIKQEISKPTNQKTPKIKQVNALKETAIEPQKDEKGVVVKQNIQVNPNVEKTRAGVYRVTQYSQKGEAQGKTEARFTRSKKTGKMYFEVNKDGKRVTRMTLEQAKKKFQTTDRPTMVERAVNGKLNKETGKYDMRQSNAPVIKNTSQNSVEKKPVKVKGEVKNSKAFQRVQERLGEYADMDVNYNRLNLAKDTAAAIEFVEKNPKEAKKIALGLMGAPEGVTETAISIALAEKAAEQKDYALQAQLERSRSLRQTRRGQEIVAERGRFNENSSHFFMQQVLAARTENAGKQKFKFFNKPKNGVKAETEVQVKLKEGTEAVKATVKKKLNAADLAQSVIDSLTC